METISSSKDFKLIFKSGKKVDSGPIRLWYLEKKVANMRICFIGRSKKAIYRNRIRRRLKEGFRVYFYPFLCDSNYDLIFMSDERLISADFREIIRWMRELLEKSGVANGAVFGSEN
ncbi:MAG TPA: ribonuclease P protein component [Candidatus Atribacteria bacterium]|jgi:ribonuclease P protein component|uniref:Ribonuclease P protein component n=1 Tax=Atribacter laminatus TaxID=2847778 RepID=A0A7T1F2H5_ATRLM|nr:Ribonuclease P protein component [Atribacter laminatus]HAX98243.1 ribonuclease P protein component [Candidatus Atribacteria bacterium]HCU22951.1 ribonuclease P protein component [Candidatus Atribacteria bacterium]